MRSPTAIDHSALKTSAVLPWGRLYCKIGISATSGARFLVVMLEQKPAIAPNSR
ncbi:hypothetical protein [Leptolyngbya sp. CCY15150]|uniref:hypothetical protein n=1 Tax=Leptolyngbya sp. CCY15150 TaxID=2767772 RepID=UPI00194EFD8F|nr:hypothetical protein [Leptolyngbya sp. CCY15150]